MNICELIKELRTTELGEQLKNLEDCKERLHLAMQDWHHAMNHIIRLEQVAQEQKDILTAGKQVMFRRLPGLHSSGAPQTPCCYALLADKRDEAIQLTRQVNRIEGELSLLEESFKSAMAEWLAAKRMSVARETLLTIERLIYSERLDLEDGRS